jgi:riboflavin kinase/FMN adenylyltransferase
VYIETVLLERFQAVFIVAGHDYTFGLQGEGTPAKLTRYCQSRGIGCAIIPPKRIGGVRVSSTYIRGLVSEGDMEQTARFLGHRYRLSGTVERGRGLGRQFGFPTVNFPLPHERQSPEWGVYATTVHWKGRPYPAVTNVGIRPSFGHGGAPVVESTLLDFEGDLYGERVDVDFIRFIRPEKKFSSPEALVAQVRKDVEAGSKVWDT